MEEKDAQLSEELRTPAHVLDLVYELYTFLQTCCSTEGISAMHEIERELHDIFVKNAVRFMFKGSLKTVEGIINGVLIQRGTIAVDFAEGHTVSFKLNELENIVFGEVKQNILEFYTTVIQIRFIRQKLIRLGLINKSGNVIKESGKCSEDENDLLLHWSLLQKGQTIERVATFE